MKQYMALVIVAALLTATQAFCGSPKNPADGYLAALSSGNAQKAEEAWKEFRAAVPLREQPDVVRAMLEKGSSEAVLSILHNLVPQEGLGIEWNYGLTYQITRHARSSEVRVRAATLAAVESHARIDPAYFPLCWTFMSDSSEEVRQEAVSLLPKDSQAEQVMRVYLALNSGDKSMRATLSLVRKRLRGEGRVAEWAKESPIKSAKQIKKIYELWSSMDGDSGRLGIELFDKMLTKNERPSGLIQLWEYAVLRGDSARADQTKKRVISYMSWRLPRPASAYPALLYLVVDAARARDVNVRDVSATFFSRGKNVNWPMVLFFLSDPASEVRGTAMDRIMGPETQKPVAIPIVESYKNTSTRILPSDPMLPRIQGYLERHCAKGNY